MRLNAISAGYAIPNIDFDASIHSVFQSAVNLRPTNNDLLLTLVVASEADLPQGIRLDSTDDFSFEQLSGGRDVFCRGSTLIFENSPLVVGFSQARRWQCNLPALGADLTKPAVKEAWKYVWQTLNECQVKRGAEIVAQGLFHSDGGAQSSISRQAGKAICTLIENTRRYTLDDSFPLTSLIGLGNGLTPSGDDIMIGYLAGLWCTVRDFVERKQYSSNLSKAIIQLLGRTNDISRTYLYHAAYGQVSSLIENLARAICRPEDRGQLLLITDSVMQSGHTSGMDAVTGLLLGLATWGGETILAY
jgi:hypothetical protein